MRNAENKKSAGRVHAIESDSFRTRPRARPRKSVLCRGRGTSTSTTTKENPLTSVLCHLSSNRFKL